MSDPSLLSDDLKQALGGAGSDADDDDDTNSKQILMMPRTKKKRKTVIQVMLLYLSWLPPLLFDHSPIVLQPAEVKPAEVISKKKRKLLVKQKKEREKRGLRGEVLSQVLFMLHHFFDDTPLSLSHVCSAESNPAEPEASGRDGVF